MADNIVWGPACKFLQTEYGHQRYDVNLTGGSVSSDFMRDFCKEVRLAHLVEFIELAHIKLRIATPENDVPGYHIWWEWGVPEMDVEEVDFS